MVNKNEKKLFINSQQLSKQLKEKKEALERYEEAATAQKKELLERYKKVMEKLDKVEGDRKNESNGAEE